MQITERVDDEKIVLTLLGRFDWEARKPFLAVIQQAKSANPRHIILNVAQVPFIDSVGLCLLILAHENLSKVHIHLSLVGPQDSMLGILQLAKIDDRMPVYVTEHDATLKPVTA